MATRNKYWYCLGMFFAMLFPLDIFALLIDSKTNLRFDFQHIDQTKRYVKSQELFNDGATPLKIYHVRACCGATYNGENRPIYWSNGVTKIVMSFDRMGRRVLYLGTTSSITNANNTFTYDNYLCIARNRALPDGQRPTDGSPEDYEADYESLMGRGMKLRESDFRKAFCDHIKWEACDDSWWKIWK